MQTFNFTYTFETLKQALQDLEQKSIREISDLDKKALMDRAFKNYISSEISSVHGFSLIDTSNPKVQWAKLTFTPDHINIHVQDEDPDKPNKLKEDGLQIRWVTIPSWASVRDTETSCTLGSVKYPGKSGRNSQALIKTDLPCSFPYNLNIKKKQFKGVIYSIIGDLYKSPHVNFCLDESNSRYFSNNPSAVQLDLRVDFRYMWKPNPDHLYITEKITPPPRDPALVGVWNGLLFHLDSWEVNNDKEALKNIESKFVV